MDFFRKASLPRKQMLVIMLTTGVALLLVCATFAVYEVVTFRKNMVRNLSTLAEIVGNNSAAALDFNDDRAAEETLSALRAEPNIVAAGLYAKNGELFVQYRREGSARQALPKVQLDTHYFDDRHLNLFRNIVQKGETTGVVYLQADLRVLTLRLEQYAVIALAVLLTVLALAFFISVRLQSLISAPILELVATTRAVTQRQDYSLRAAARSEDEIGVLIDGFNNMLAQIQARDGELQKGRDELERRVAMRTQDLRDHEQKLLAEIAEHAQAEARLHETHHELLATSRLAGMAEVATGVLHNVGNVLTSVNVSATLISDRVRQSKAASLEKVSVLLREQQGRLGYFLEQDSRGQQLPGYLQTLANHLAEERKQILLELESLRNNIEHINEIVSMQQSYAKVSGVMEIIDIRVLVEDALRLNAEALARHQVRLIRDYVEMAPVTIDRHKVLQILVNLIRNAKHACDENASTEEKQVTVRLRRGENDVEIAVMDNGVGIAPENLTRIFSHGFTTRKEGHGFGLHSGALAARELGGSLTASSEGIGRGASFILLLPASPSVSGRANLSI